MSTTISSPFFAVTNCILTTQTHNAVTSRPTQRGLSLVNHNQLLLRSLLAGWGCIESADTNGAFIKKVTLRPRYLLYYIRPGNYIIDTLLPLISNDVQNFIICFCAIYTTICLQDRIKCPALNVSESSTKNERDDDTLRCFRG